MQICAVVELMCMIIIIFTVGLAAEILIAGGSINVGLLLFCVGCVCGLIIAYLTKYIKSLSEHSETYVIQLSNLTLQSIINDFAATEVGFGGYISFHNVGNYLADY